MGWFATNEGIACPSGSVVHYSLAFMFAVWLCAYSLGVCNTPLRQMFHVERVDFGRNFVLRGAFILLKK